jgi:hypothetical protein
MAPEAVVSIREMLNVPFIGKILRNVDYYTDHVWSRDFWEIPSYLFMNT